jgi:hypothetical protein
VESRLRLYVREGCHLCEDALDVLRVLDLEVVDIGGDAGLEAWYGERVPVLVRGDELIAQGAFDAIEVLEQLLGQQPPNTEASGIE